MGTALGKIFKTLRKNAGLTQRDVSDKLGYGSPQLVSNIERGVSFPPVKAIARLAKLFKVDADFLFEELLEAKLKREEAKLRKQYVRPKR